MNKTRKAIIELIEKYMDKTLSEGCLIKNIADNVFLKLGAKQNDYFMTTIYGKKEMYMEEYMKEHFTEEYKDIYKILGHYDITAVLKIFKENNYDIKFNYSDYIQVVITDAVDSNIWKIHGGFPNKPLHLYTEQEEKELLELLKKLGNTQ